MLCGPQGGTLLDEVYKEKEGMGRKNCRKGEVERGRWEWRKIVAGIGGDKEGKIRG